MPIIRRWFENPKDVPWETLSESPFSEIRGPEFYTYPLTWLVPYVELTRDDLKDAPTPLWITDVSPTSELGIVNDEEEGSFVILLPESFEMYLETLSSSARKKYKATLRKNEDLELRHDHKTDIDLLWPFYVERLQTLAKNSGGEPYTEKELSLRREFYSGSSIRTMSFVFQSEVLACNVSLWEKDVVFDLACLIRPSADALRRSLGAVAILRNIELAIKKGITNYDMLSNDYGYKKSFGATEHKMKSIVVCSDSFANHYRIPQGMYVTNLEKL